MKIRCSWLQEKIIKQESQKRKSTVFYKKIREHVQTYKGKVHCIKNNISEDGLDFSKIYKHFKESVLVEQDDLKRNKRAYEKDNMMEDELENTSPAR